MSLTKEQKKAEFESLWKRWPNKDSRKQSEANFNKSVKTYQGLEDINTALNNYLDMLKTETWRKCKSGSTFFNNWPDWSDYKSPQRPQEIINNSKPVKPLTPERIKDIKHRFSDEHQAILCQKLKAAWLMRRIVY